MKIFVDNHEWIPPQSVAGDRESLWRELSGNISSRGEVVYSIEVNNEEISPEGFLQISDEQDVFIKTKPVRLLVQESLEDAMQYMPKLQEGYKTIADKLEEEDMASAQSLLSHALEGTQWLLGVIQGASVLLGELAFSPEESEDLMGNGIAKVLTDMEGALEGGRFFEIALLIRDALLPELDKLNTYLEKLYKLAFSEVQ